LVFKIKLFDMIAELLSLGGSFVIEFFYVYSLTHESKNLNVKKIQ